MARPPESRRAARAIGWGTFIFSLLLAAFWLTWLTWSAAGFSYGFWHEAVGLDDNIAEFGPQNRYRQGFEKTTEAERIRLFEEIVIAINRDPDRLAGLTYHAPGGRPLGRLLRPPEVQHLEDVAWLVGLFRVTGWTAVVLTPLLGGLILHRRWPLPTWRSLATGAGVIAAAVTALLVIAGPTTVFYHLHIWIFPADHQWFFYYQESLMSTMMRAPVLFGAIAVQWTVTAVPLAVLGLLVHRWLHRRLRR